MASTVEVTFDVNERVLCYHGPLIYEAKVTKPPVQHDETTAPSGVPGPYYFVHYKGWKQTWDEWVPVLRLLKFNEQNLALQKSLHQTANPNTGQGGSVSASAKAAHGAGTKGGTRTAARKDGRGTKRAREEDDASKKPDMKLVIPELLKVVLVDDWEAITKNNQLVSLPRSPTVQELLEQWQEYMLKLEPKPNYLREPKLVLPTIVSGLTCYFDRSLGANLLYRFERPQYANVRKQYITGAHVIVGQEKEMSQIYGAEHFLRMLVSLPQMIACSTLDMESVHLIRDYVNELLIWISNEREQLFLAEYPSASLPYQNVSRS
ncbi:MRG-domain-containing protein [Macrolepiota fuliginosa MF-IS2]|uniref:Chromatin modification-related protein EAF3 n=1 Tax=Macrolepiota fuliginosa MF-IS2 TaxID=1400762 RepID=A0A9P6C338_9AGAR|nr:MRG-domain-containing protein [Macrolepiota fuliginosa MF-IS2]